MGSKIILKTKRENMPSITVSFKKSSHDIDVDTYIGTLRSLSVIAKEVNYKLSNRSDIQLNVVTQKEGSFEAILSSLPALLVLLPCRQHQRYFKLSTRLLNCISLRGVLETPVTLRLLK